MPRINPTIVFNGKRHGVDWHQSRSPHGHLLDEVLSAAIKELRRGNEEHALYWALEMMSCDQAPEMGKNKGAAAKFLWECLVVFTAEDIGLANPEAISIVAALREGFFSIPVEDNRRLVFLANATSYLSRSKKSRYVSELLEDLRYRIESGAIESQIPDYAIDKHTTRGKALGRGKLHYLTEASLLENKGGPCSGHYLEHLIVRAQK